ncbi:tetratricopeptide repeat protein [Myxococcus sp. AM009]|uniref:tetratricopeptide repeat protein n=1 Tax=unclassified Myxococcus TaxID=2648731 RepID=UPI0015954675|nr:tetratricopeptide repeat protein [Myxococcus sp. AM009]NVJ18231.1 tetratricopeptide repeat protein [Myxococcus sp. AM010]
MAGTTKTEKIRQKELSQPDTFQKAGTEASDWLAQRQKIIGLAAGVLILGGVGVAIASEVSKRGEEKAAQALGQALTVLDRPVEGVEPAQPGETEPPFKTVKERDEAVVKALGEFRAAHGGTPSAATAALAEGKAQFRLGNYAAAQAAFGEYLKGAPQNDPLRAEALEGQGYALEADGKYEDAIKAFEQMGAAGGPFLLGMGDYHKARMLILLGKKEEAAQVLSKLTTAQPNTAAARQAGERLAVLASEGVKVPAPEAPAAAPAPDAG